MFALESRRTIDRLLTQLSSALRATNVAEHTLAALGLSSIRAALFAWTIMIQPVSLLLDIG